MNKFLIVWCTILHPYQQNTPTLLYTCLPSSAYKQPGSNQQPIGWAEFPD